jgi:hypothetical protein
MKSAPHVPCAVANVNVRHLPEEVLHPTACARSHCSWAVHESLTFPAMGVMHVDCPAGHTVPALHEFRTHVAPAEVGGWQTPHAASGARAQNVVAHCASSAHAPLAATVPGAVLQDAPRSPARNAGHPRPAMAAWHVAVFAGVALVPGAPKAGKQANVVRSRQTTTSP